MFDFQLMENGARGLDGAVARQHVLKENKPEPVHVIILPQVMADESAVVTRQTPKIVIQRKNAQVRQSYWYHLKIKMIIICCKHGKMIT